MKKTRQCPRCSSLEVGLIEALDEATMDGASYVAVGVMRYRPEVVSSVRRTRGGVLTKDQSLAARETTTKAGTVEAYVCARCGYLERHVQDPAWLPFERLQGFTWVNGEVEP